MVGGRLFLTNKRLVHRPGNLDRLLRASDWEASLRDITSVSPGPRFTSLIGALGQQLRVESSSGDLQVFRVWRARRLKRRIGEEITLLDD
jgi:hypothetical protein